MRLLLISLMAIHGLIHLMGFAKAFGYAEMSQLKQPVSTVAGVAWLAGCAAFLAAGVLYVTGVGAWHLAAWAAIVLSQVLIFSAWDDAKFGTIANLLILLPATASALDARPTSFRGRFDAAVRESLAQQQGKPQALVNEDDLRPLPALVQRYLRVVGAVGRPRVASMRIVFTGEFRNGLKAEGGAFRAEQVSTFAPPMRAFLMKMPMYGLPTEGFHLMQQGHASMQIKLASAVQVVDARGPVMDQSETVTFFNDLCLLAPAQLIDRERIQWEEDGPQSVRAVFTLNGITIRARLVFNDAGELVDFISNDRYFSTDGKTHESYPWSTPVRSYQIMNGGRRVPRYAEAVWHTPDGPFVYGKFNVERITYDGGS